MFRVLSLKVTSFILKKQIGQGNVYVDGPLKSTNSKQGSRRPCGAGLWLSAELLPKALGSSLAP